MMRFRWLRPLRGWRAFLGEVGVIVLGVLLALAAQEAVSRWNWHQDVGAARQSLHADALRLLGYAAERAAEDACIRRRLWQLESLITDNPTTLPPLGHIGSPALRAWRPASWQTAVASQVATHFPRKELLALSDIDIAGADLDMNQAQELDDWAMLYTLVGTGRRLEPGELSRIRVALRDAAYRANIIRLDAGQSAEQVRRLNLVTAAEQRMLAEELRRTLTGPNAIALCGPIGPPTKGLVDAPYDPRIQEQIVDREGQPLTTSTR